MRALTDFFTTDYGLLSAVVIAITLGMGVFYARFFARHIREDTERAEREAAAAAAAARAPARRR
jgi:peptidoglycan/LPS O-acetylase OafA/YrhL